MSARLKAIIESYCASLPGEIDALDQRQADGLFDYEAVRFAAHRLKGTARSLGLEKLDVALFSVESAAREMAANPSCYADRQGELAAGIEALRAICATIQPSESRMWAMAAPSPADAAG